MKPFEYRRPESLKEAFGLLMEHGPAAQLLAGGTDLLVQLRLRRKAPGVVIDLKRIQTLRPDILETGSRLRVGACTVMSTLLGDSRVQKYFPALVEAARVVGSVQIRNRATLAGNICNASPAADTAPALLAYGALVNLIGDSHSRSVPLCEFFAGPGRTVLQSGEIVESIDLPLEKGSGAAFGRITRRHGVDLATINLCCLVTASGETRFAYGSAGPRPILVKDPTGALASTGGNTHEGSRILAEMIAQATPRDDVRGARDYRLAMLDVMSRRCLRVATERRSAASKNV
jgi:CO/xanthine dehydrogenase FAD-binding subunit